MRTPPFQLAVAAFTLALAATSVARAGEVRGRLLIGERPAAGVTVSAIPYEAPLAAARRQARRLPEPQPLASVLAGADGSFMLAVAAEPGKETLFTVRIEGGGAAAAGFTGVWDAAESTVVGEHVLLPGGAVWGKVVDASGRPAADAEVELTPPVARAEEADLEPVARRERTSADGTFRLEGAAAAGNDLVVERAGSLPARLTGVRAGALAAPVGLTAGVAVRGAVRGLDGRSPAAGALVRLVGWVTTRWVETGADGTFAVPAAPTGVVTAVADTGDGGYAETSNVSLPLAQGAALTLVLRPPASLAGRVLDAKTGKPVRARIEARAAGVRRAARSGPDGSYALRDLPPRSWQVRADEARYVPWAQARVPVRVGEARKLDIPLVLGAAIAGRVTDEDGKPVAGARGALARMGPIDVRRAVQRIAGGEAPVFRTGPDGTFSAARLVPGGSQVLTVSHPQFERATVGGVALLPGVNKTGVRIVLKRGFTVAGVVRDVAAQPIAGAEVALSQPLRFGGGRPGPGRGAAILGAATAAAPDRKGATTGSDGTFGVTGVPPGEFVLTVSRVGYATERVEPVKVGSGKSPAPIAVTLAPGATISGRVVRKSGEGAEGFVVRAASPGIPRFDGAAAAAQPTGAGGEFSIEGLKTGRSYDLLLAGPGAPGEGRRGVVAPASGVVLTVAGPGRITGRAVDASDGHPVAEFEVSYEPDRGGFRAMARGGRAPADAGAGGPGRPVEVQSADGSFALEDVPAGSWSVVVSARGYQTARAAGVEVTEGATADGVDVPLTRGVALRGRVVDASTGAPVPGASVSIPASGQGGGRGPAAGAASAGEAATDGDGRFEIEGVAPGKQPMRVTHPDYADTTQIVPVADDGATVEVRLTAGGSLTGVVVSDAGQPVANANVTLVQQGAAGFGFGGGAGSQANVSDPSGQFRFENLSAGRYTLEATLGSHTSAPVEAVVQVGQPTQGVTLQLQLGVTVQGTVSGLPEGGVAGTTVTAVGADTYAQSTRVAPDGRFEFENVPAGVVTLRATATDTSGSTRSVTKQITTTEDQPVVTADLVFDQGYTLSGRVTQAGQAVAGAMVFANLQGGGGRQASAATDDGGAYQLAGLQAGTYAVNAMSPQAGASARETVEVAADQTLDIVLPSAKIFGQVVDADGGLPLANATVTARPQDAPAAPGPGQRPATTDSTGQFSFSGLDEAVYTLSTSKPDYQVDTSDATATDAGTDTVVVSLKRAAGIAVRVQDGVSGVPLPSVTVRVLDSQGAPAFGPAPITLDSAGQGEIPSLPPGTYTVLAGASGYAPVELDGVSVPSGTVAVFLTQGGTVQFQAGPKTLAAGTASGTVTTAGGRPALLSLFNLEGRIAISEPSVQLRNVPTGSYVLALPALELVQAFVVSEGGATPVPLP